MKNLLFFIPVILLFSCTPGNKSARSGKEVYIQNCNACHGMDGKKKLANAADLSLSTLSFEEQKNVVINGRNVMASFKNTLTTSEIDSVVTFIQSLKK